MKRIIVAIIDNKANDIVGNYLYIQRAMATAVRMFQDSMAQPDTMFAKHPEDFDLWELGELDEQAMTITGPATILITGKAMKASLNGLGPKDKPATIKRA